MSAHGAYEPRTAFGRFVNSFEENAIAVLLGLMTVITFVNVILRYMFNSMVIWGLEVVLIMFAWLVLLGMSYAVKVSAHLGVDALTNILPAQARKAVALVAAAACLAYAGLLLKGAWDYWAPFAALPETDGRWFPLGFNENTRDRAFFETDQVPMLPFLRFLEDLINQGDSYSKLPRVVPYTILPISAALLLYRFIEATIDIWTGKRTSLIVSHEVEDAIDDLARQRSGQE